MMRYLLVETTGCDKLCLTRAAQRGIIGALVLLQCPLRQAEPLMFLPPSVDPRQLRFEAYLVAKRRPKRRI